MRATTVTNADGTFSPAIVFKGSEGERQWVEQTFRLKDEDKAVLIAQTHLAKLENAVTRMLIEGKYKPDPIGRR